MSEASPIAVATGPNINSRLDRLPVTKHHVLWLVVLGLAFLIETFDLSVFAYVAPSIRENWNLSLGQVGVVTSAGFIGMFVGAVAGGRLSDRFGRRPVLIWASVLYSLMSLLSAVAPNFEIMFLSRIFTGVGVQAATGVLLVYVGEMFPRTKRGRSFTVLMFIGYFGSPATALTAAAIAPTGIEAWRWVFVIGSAGFIIALAAALWLPESVRWLVMRDKDAKAERVVVRLEEAVVRRGVVLADLEPDVPVTQPGSFRDLFRPLPFRRLVVMSAASLLYYFTAFGFVSWIPTILTERGMPKAEALGFASVLSIATVLAPLILFFVADKIERKTTLLTASLLSGATLVTFAFAASPTMLMVAGFTAQLSISMMAVTFFTYMPEVFPTNVRGAASGVVMGVGRIAGVIAGLTVAGIYSGLGFQTLYGLLAAVVVCSGLIAAIFGARTTNRSLESISEKAENGF